MSSYTSGSEEEAKAFEYWGKFVPDPPQGDPDMVVDSFRFSRLIIGTHLECTSLSNGVFR
jgi:hypothetical protein